jgi:murein DD-endopeptidase MepM/ murein hydrolase activator NlpD
LYLVKNPIRTSVFQLSKNQVTRFIKNATRHSQDQISWIILTLVVGLVVFSNIAYAGKLPLGSTLLSNTNLGGPLDASLGSIGVLQGNGVLGLPGDEDSTPDIPVVNSNIINGLNAPEGYTKEASTPVTREYIVQQGDTLDSIAQKFGISSETVAIANDIKDLKKNPAINTNLDILPEDGIEVTLKEGQSLADLASKYSVSEQIIRDYNNIGDNLALGNTIIIPNAVVPNEEKPFPTAEPVQPKKVASKKTTPVASPKTASLPSDDGYFAFPTTGINHRVVHSNNGVDISNSCGTPIYASAEGVITTSQNGWNGGYGNYIKITHPNGVVTLYGHLSSRDLQVGDSVNKGQYIGAMGTTGNSTGCHLHFEVRGARNPLAR